MSGEPKEFAVRLALLEDGDEATYVVWVPVRDGSCSLVQAIDEAKQIMLESIANDYARVKRV